MAGELSSGEKPSCKSDIYAFGGLILTVMSNKAPFHGLSHLVILRRITLNEIPKPEDHPGLPAQDPLWEVMRRCWDPSPAARPTITEVLIELEGDIGREEPTSRSSPDLGSASDDGGSGYPEKSFD
ncbi:Ankyrin repeat and protein kinase domain-containing protein 1, partial [Tulasnella sp. 417]